MGRIEGAPRSNRVYWEAFGVGETKEPPSQNERSVRAQATAWGKRLNQKFSVQREPLAVRRVS